MNFARPFFAASALLLSLSASAQTTPPGYDVILLAGQSNMAGYGTYPDNAAAAADADAAISPRVFMWDFNTGTIVPAQDPLVMNNPAHYVGPGLTFAKAYAASLPANRNVLLVGAARGSTGFDTYNGWLVASGAPSVNTLSGTAVLLANNAMAAAGSGARFAGIVWDQGENDIIAGGAYPDAYQGNLVNLINYFRANIVGASSNSPVVVTEMTYPFMIDNLNNVNNAGVYVVPQYKVQTTLHTLPDVLNNTAWTGSAGLPGDITWGNIHFSALSQRQMGRRDADRFFEAQLGLPQPETQLVSSNNSFFDIGRSYPNGAFPVNYLPTTGGTVTPVDDSARGTVAQISQAQGLLTFSVPATTFNGSYTKMAWFKPGANGYYNNLISANNPGQAHYLLATANADGSLILAGGHSDGNSVPLTVSTAVSAPAGTWENVALTYDAAARTMTLYYNGVAVNSAANVAPAPSLSGNPIPLNMGAFGTNANGGAVAGMDGSMAGNRVWTSALAPAQIKVIYLHELSYRAGW